MTGARPLEGVRVLDLSHVLAGPFCCHQLAHFGADVIKVEAAGRGDLARALGGDPALNARGMGVSFLAQNAGKRSVTVNLKHERGRALLRRLAATADVLVENFRPGVMDRLGVGYEALRAENPRLIYCAISGFGQTGAWRGRPAYDQIVQGASGAMSITGDPQSAPLRVGYPAADTLGGMTAAFAICAALNADPRGCFLDVSMLESMVASMGWVVSNHLIAGVAPEPLGNENMTSAPSGAFRCADGLLNIAANKDEQWRALLSVLERPELAAHPDYATREDRKRNRVALREELERTLVRRPAADWEAALNAAGVPAGAVLSVPEALESPPLRERGLVARFADAPGVGRDIAVLRTGVRIDGAPTAVNDPPPELGRHNAEVYGELGLSAEEIAQLAQEGAV